MKTVKGNWKPVARIPANVDPIKLADEIKGDLTSEWLKRYNKFFSPKRLKSHAVRQS